MAPSGVEWLIEGHGCQTARLRDLNAVDELFASLIGDMRLHPLGERVWHQFPVTGGITAMHMLTESHLACHTFPEHDSICLNVFCCLGREEADFTGLLRRHMGAATVTIRRMRRAYAAEIATEA